MKIITKAIIGAGTLAVAGASVGTAIALTGSSPETPKPKPKDNEEIQTQTIQTLLPDAVLNIYKQGDVAIKNSLGFTFDDEYTFVVEKVEEHQITLMATSPEKKVRLVIQGFKGTSKVDLNKDLEVAILKVKSSYKTSLASSTVDSLGLKDGQRIDKNTVGIEDVKLLDADTSIKVIGVDNDKGTVDIEIDFSRSSTAYVSSVNATVSSFSTAPVSHVVNVNVDIEKNQPTFKVDGSFDWQIDSIANTHIQYLVKNALGNTIISWTNNKPSDLHKDQILQAKYVLDASATDSVLKGTTASLDKKVTIGSPRTINVDADSHKPTFKMNGIIRWDNPAIAHVEVSYRLNGGAWSKTLPAFVKPNDKVELQFKSDAPSEYQLAGKTTSKEYVVPSTAIKDIVVDISKVSPDFFDDGTISWNIPAVPDVDINYKVTDAEDVVVSDWSTTIPKDLKVGEKIQAEYKLTNDDGTEQLDGTPISKVFEVSKGLKNSINADVTSVAPVFAKDGSLTWAIPAVKHIKVQYEVYKSDDTVLTKWSETLPTGLLNGQKVSAQYVLDDSNKYQIVGTAITSKILVTGVDKTNIKVDASKFVPTFKTDGSMTSNLKDVANTEIKYKVVDGLDSILSDWSTTLPTNVKETEYVLAKYTLVDGDNFELTGTPISSKVAAKGAIKALAKTLDTLATPADYVQLTKDINSISDHSLRSNKLFAFYKAQRKAADAEAKKYLSEIVKVAKKIKDIHDGKAGVITSDESKAFGEEVEKFMSISSDTKTRWDAWAYKGWDCDITTPATGDIPDNWRAWEQWGVYATLDLDADNLYQRSIALMSQEFIYGQLATDMGISNVRGSLEFWKNSDIGGYWTYILSWAIMEDRNAFADNSWHTIGDPMIDAQNNIRWVVTKNASKESKEAGWRIYQLTDPKLLLPDLKIRYTDSKDKKEHISLQFDFFNQSKEGMRLMALEGKTFFFNGHLPPGGAKYGSVDFTRSPEVLSDADGKEYVDLRSESVDNGETLYKGYLKKDGEFTTGSSTNYVSRKIYATDKAGNKHRMLTWAYFDDLSLNQDTTTGYTDSSWDSPMNPVRPSLLRFIQAEYRTKQKDYTGNSSHEYTNINKYLSGGAWSYASIDSGPKPKVLALGTGGESIGQQGYFVANKDIPMLDIKSWREVNLVSAVGNIAGLTTDTLDATMSVGHRQNSINPHWKNMGYYSTITDAFVDRTNHDPDKTKENIDKFSARAQKGFSKFYMYEFSDQDDDHRIFTHQETLTGNPDLDSAIKTGTFGWQDVQKHFLDWVKPVFTKYGGTDTLSPGDKDYDLLYNFAFDKNITKGTYKDWTGGNLPFASSQFASAITSSSSLAEVATKLFDKTHGNGYGNWYYSMTNEDKDAIKAFPKDPALSKEAQDVSTKFGTRQITGFVISFPADTLKDVSLVDTSDLRAFLGHFKGFTPKDPTGALPTPTALPDFLKDWDGKTNPPDIYDKVNPMDLKTGEGAPISSGIGFDIDITPGSVDKLFNH